MHPAIPVYRRSCARFLLLTALSLAGAIAGASTSSFAAFPEKPLRLVVPFSPGGGTDLIARTLAASLATELGQPVIIENKPGGGTIVGSDLVAKSAPDGHTLLVATFAHAVNPSLQPKLPYATDKDFAPVVLIGRSHNVLVVKSESPIKSVKDILETAKAEPGKLTFASQGNGTSAHLAGELFKNLGGLELTHVPYRGAAPAINDLLGGQVDMMFATSAAVGGFLEAKTLRAIATTAPAGSPPSLGAPSIADSGVPGYVVESWYAIYAPAATPKEIIRKINASVLKAMQTEAFAKRAKQEGLTISGGSPEELDRYVRQETERWRKVVIENKITPD